MILKGLRLELCKHFFRVLLALLITLRQGTRALPEPALPNASASEQTIRHLPGPRLVLTFGGWSSPLTALDRQRLAVGVDRTCVKQTEEMLSEPVGRVAGLCI